MWDHDTKIEVIIEPVNITATSMIDSDSDTNNSNK